MTSQPTKITVEAIVNAPMDRVWHCWISPEDIKQWCQASDAWHAPHAENDVREGGAFVTRMAAKDGSAAFDFSGTYTKVQPHHTLAYTLADGRTVVVEFRSHGTHVHVHETFEAESTHPPDAQREGWQAILNNFKRYAEHTA